MEAEGEGMSAADFYRTLTQLGLGVVFAVVLGRLLGDGQINFFEFFALAISLNTAAVGFLGFLKAVR